MMELQKNFTSFVPKRHDEDDDCAHHDGPVDHLGHDSHTTLSADLGKFPITESLSLRSRTEQAFLGLLKLESLESFLL